MRWRSKGIAGYEQSVSYDFYGLSCPSGLFDTDDAGHHLNSVSSEDNGVSIAPTASWTRLEKALTPCE